MKNLLIKLLGPLLAIAGVLGLTGSSILWNFQGRNFGIPATILSLLLLAAGVVILRPLSSSTPNETPDLADKKDNGSDIETTDQNPTVGQEPKSVKTAENTSDSNQTETITPASEQKPSLTTAEAIAAELASADAARPKITLVNFAPEALRAGNALRQNRRTAGKNLAGFKDMASELFKTK